MPWQKHVLDVALEVDPDTGLLAYREVRLWVPRQAGKTTLIMALLLWRCISFFDQACAYMAQTRNHARQKWEDEHLKVLRRSRSIRPLFKPRKTNGNEAFLFTNGSKWGIDSTTEKSGHGGTMDLVVADEFFAQEDDRIENGARPTMVTRPQPQIWFISTFGDEDDTRLSGPLWKKVDDSRERCRTGEHGSVCSFEWSAADYDDDSIDYADPDLWFDTHPALGHTITEKTLADELDSVGDRTFARAYLNLRPRRKVKPATIPAEKWSGSHDPTSRPHGAVALGFDVSPDGEFSAIAAVGENAAGRIHGEVIEHLPGTEWVPDKIGDLLDRNPDVRRVAMDAAGPAAAILPAVRRVVNDRKKRRPGLELVELPTRRVSAGCGAFLDAVLTDRFRHLDQMSLNEARANARKRVYGQDGGWLWDRRSMVDVTPIIAVTVGARALDELDDKRPVRSVYEDDDLAVV